MLLGYGIENGRIIAQGESLTCNIHDGSWRNREPAARRLAAAADRRLQLKRT
jgi:hypothetical protein